MKILLYTDNHWSNTSSIVTGMGDKYTLRLENQIKSLNWVEEQAISNKCEMIICLGDFFDKPVLDAKEITALSEIKWSDIPHVFLVGNHEMASNDLQISSAHLLKFIPKSKVIDKPTMDSNYGCELFFLPYILESNRKPLREYIDTVSRDYWSDMWTTDEYKHLIIFSHNDISGVQYGKFETKTGFSIKEIEENCSYFINGHLHNQCNITDKIFNLGNLTGQNFNEDGFKYFHDIGILDTDTLNIELIHNPYAFYFYKFGIENEEDLKNLTNLKDNSIITLKVYEDLVEETKQEIEKNKSILVSRIVVIPRNKKVRTKKENTINSINHIEELKKYCIDKLGDSSEVLYELNKL